MAAGINQGEATVKVLLAHPRGFNDSIVHCNVAALDWLLGSHAITRVGIPASARIASADRAFKRCRNIDPVYAWRWQKVTPQAAGANHE